jgi:hypothetical protein
MRSLRTTLLGAAGLCLSGSSPAWGLSLGFGCITDHSAAHCAVGAAQLSVEVSEPFPHLVRFQFANTGPAASSITDVYFDNGPLLPISLILDTRHEVEFSHFASPSQLPGGATLDPPFVSGWGFTADSDWPIVQMGVNPGESLGFVFLVHPHETFADVIGSLADGSLRIGLKLQGFTDGGWESFVNLPAALRPEVPEPAALGLLGLLGLAVRQGVIGRAQLAGSARARKPVARGRPLPIPPS